MTDSTLAMVRAVDLDQGLLIDRDIDAGAASAERDRPLRDDFRGYGLGEGSPDAEALSEDAPFIDAAPFATDPVIDVDIEDVEDLDMPPQGKSLPPRIAERFNTETRFHGLSLSQLAVHSLWIVDYLRQLGETEMADGDLDSIGRCADDLEGAIMLMFQLAGGTRQELRQRYHEIKLAMHARQPVTVDLGRAQ